MHNELRYHAKTHALSKKLSKEKIKFRIFSLNYYYFLLFFIFNFFFVEKWDKKKKKKNMLMEKEITSSPSM